MDEKTQEMIVDPETETADMVMEFIDDGIPFGVYREFTREDGKRVDGKYLVELGYAVVHDQRDESDDHHRDQRLWIRVVGKFDNMGQAITAARREIRKLHR